MKINNSVKTIVLAVMSLSLSQFLSAQAGAKMQKKPSSHLSRDSWLLHPQATLHHLEDMEGELLSNITLPLGILNNDLGRLLWVIGEGVK